MAKLRTASGTQAAETSRIRKFFVQHVNALALAPGASVDTGFQVSSQAAFVIDKLAYVADINNAGQTANSRVIPNISINLVDSNGYQWVSAPSPVPNIFGPEGLAYILRAPVVLDPAVNLTVTLANYDSAITYNLRLSFIGALEFSLGAGGGA